MDKFSFFRKTLAVILCAAVSAAASGCYLLPDEEEVLAAPTVKATEVTYTTVTATRKDLVKQTVNSGTILSQSQYNLSYESEGGTISEFYVHVGDSVSEGDPICTLDTSELEYQIQITELQRESAYLNTVVLYESGCTQAEYDKAYVDVELLDIELEKLNTQLDEAVLTSPADGTISELADISVGDYASPGQTIATVMQTDDLYIAIEPNDLTLFPIGQELQIRIDEEYYDGEVFMNPDALVEYQAELAESHEAEDDTGIEYETDKIYVKFTEDPPSDVVGSLADTILVQETVENCIAISNNLIKSVNGEDVVYVLKDGVKTAVTVEIGLQTGSQSEIISGIEEGDELVIR
ncbi:MAG: efflux RND transporter periplasmic adaptor subunit [Ruminococcus sp.]|nr:efflux RND transporter periplasmic adaptor subunit [Ruminococcus sp.]